MQYGRDVIGRRGLLLSGALAGAGYLTGCTLGERVEWLPWNPPEPLPVQVPQPLPAQVAATAALAEHLLANAEEWELSTRRTDTLRWFVRTTTDHAQTLMSRDPARRTRVTTALPQVPAPTQTSAAATQERLTESLGELRSGHTSRALATDGPAALLWASMAAFSATMARVLPAGAVRLGDDGATSTPDLSATGPAQVLAYAAQAIYAYELALAAARLTDRQTVRLRIRLQAWRQFGDALLRSVPGLTAPVPPLGYERRPASNWAAAHALAAEAESGALPVFGAWLAGTSSEGQRRLAVDALTASNRAAVSFAAPALRWPGWPG